MRIVLPCLDPISPVDPVLPLVRRTGCPFLETTSQAWALRAVQVVLGSAGVLSLVLLLLMDEGNAVALVVLGMAAPGAVGLRVMDVAR